jgi:hypothetical protein
MTAVPLKNELSLGLQNLGERLLPPHVHQQASTNTTMRVLFWPESLARTPAERMAAMRSAMDEPSTIDPRESATFQSFSRLPVSNIQGFSLSGD